MLNANIVLQKMRSSLNDEVFMNECILYKKLACIIENDIKPIDKSVELSIEFNRELKGNVLNRFDELVSNIKIDFNDNNNVNKYIKNSKVIYYLKHDMNKTFCPDTLFNTFLTLGEFCNIEGSNNIMKCANDTCDKLGIKSEKIVIINEDKIGISISNPVINRLIHIIKVTLLESGHNIDNLKF